MISWYWFEEIVRPIRRKRFGGLLRFVSDLRQVTVQQTGGHFIADDGFDRWPADPHLPMALARGPDDRIGRDFGLEIGGTGCG